MSSGAGAARSSIDWAWLRRMAPRVVVFGALAGWALAVASGGEGERHAWGGDYPAFQMAGKVALDGRLGELYDFDLQERYEQGMPRDGLLPFLYPPFVAAAYAPLALLPYRTAYALYTLLALAALAGSVALVRPLSPTVAKDPWLAFAFVLLFYPMLRAVFGGQNTPISLLILCATWRLLHERRDVAAGLVLGVLSYKPQLVVPIAGAVFVAGRFRAAFAAAVSAAILFLASGLVAGWSWPQKWIAVAGDYAKADRVFNQHSSIALGQITDLFGWEHGWIVLSGGLSAWVAWIAWSRGRRDFFGVFAIAITAALLVPPHAMYYDAGVALPALVVVADRGRIREAVLLWLAGAAQLAAFALPLSPLIFVLVATLVAVRSSMENRSASLPAER